MLGRVTFGFSQKVLHAQCCAWCSSNNNGQYQFLLSHCESFLLLRLYHSDIGIVVDKLEKNIAISNIPRSVWFLTKMLHAHVCIVLYTVWLNQLVRNVT